MAPNNIQEIVAAPLKYGSSTKPLKITALSQLIAKALYLSSTSITKDEIAKKTGELINKTISIERIEHSLSYLHKDKKIILVNNKYSLSPGTKKEISDGYNLYRRLQNRILGRLFPKNINKSVLEKWFEDASIAFFSHYSDEWVESVCKDTKHKLPKNQTLEGLLKPSIEQHALQKHADDLTDGFLKFLSSENEEDNLHLMNLGYAMFSARLVASDIGIDPLTLSELQDSKFILDTNFLINIVLGNQRLSTAINALGQALQKIRAKLVLIFETKQEYTRAISGAKGEIIGLLRQYDIDIVAGTDNDFIHAATKLGCKNTEDFERFFDNLTLPNQIPSGPIITIEDDAEIKTVTEKAQNNNRLKKEIRTLSKRTRPQWMQKSETAISHDAALLEAGALIRSREAKSWILSFDKTIQACAKDQYTQNNLPLVLTADTLIHLLALNDAGPGLKSTDFAPILSQMILRRCIPPNSTYNKTDLHMLHTINERAADLPAEKVRELLRIITRARIEGKQADDTKLQLEVNRVFQEKKLELPKELQEEKGRRLSAEENAEKEKRRRELAEERLIKHTASKIIVKAVFIFIEKTTFYLILASIVSWFIYSEIKTLPNIPFVDKLAFLSFVFTFLPIKRLWDDLIKKIRNAYSKAKKIEEKQWLQNKG